MDQITLRRILSANDLCNTAREPSEAMAFSFSSFLTLKRSIGRSVGQSVNGATSHSSSLCSETFCCDGKIKPMNGRCCLWMADASDSLVLSFSLPARLLIVVGCWLVDNSCVSFNSCRRCLCCAFSTETHVCCIPRVLWAAAMRTPHSSWKGNPNHERIPLQSRVVSTNRNGTSGMVCMHVCVSVCLY